MSALNQMIGSFTNTNAVIAVIAILGLLPVITYGISYFLLPIVRSKALLVLAVIVLVIINVILPLYLGYVALRSQPGFSRGYFFWCSGIVFFNAVFGNVLLRPGLLKGWFGKNKFNINKTPEIADSLELEWKNPTSIRVVATFILLPFALFLISFIIKLAAVLSAAVPADLFYHAFYGALAVFALMFLIHMLITQHLFKCDNCHLSVLTMSRNNKKYGNFLRVAFVLLFTSQFHCLHCEAHYHLSNDKLKK